MGRASRRSPRRAAFLIRMTSATSTRRLPQATGEIGHAIRQVVSLRASPPRRSSTQTDPCHPIWPYHHDRQETPEFSSGARAAASDASGDVVAARLGAIPARHPDIAVAYLLRGPNRGRIGHPQTVRGNLRSATSAARRSSSARACPLAGIDRTRQSHGGQSEKNAQIKHRETPL